MYIYVCMYVWFDSLWNYGITITICYRIILVKLMLLYAVLGIYYGITELLIAMLIAVYLKLSSLYVILYRIY